jgi:hypothetical protein
MSKEPDSDPQIKRSRGPTLLLWIGPFIPIVSLGLAMGVVPQCNYMPRAEADLIHEAQNQKIEEVKAEVREYRKEIKESHKEILDKINQIPRRRQ